jgi:hypothetical protein
MVKDEAIMLLEKQQRPASSNAAFRLVFRKLIEMTEPADVLAARVQQDDNDLMVGHTDLLLLPESMEGMRG